MSTDNAQTQTAAMKDEDIQQALRDLAALQASPPRARLCEAAADYIARLERGQYGKFEAGPVVACQEQTS